MILGSGISALHSGLGCADASVAVHSRGRWQTPHGRIRAGRNSEMIDRYVVSKSRQVRIPCDGPLTAQIERAQLEESMKAAGREPDVEIEYLKKPPQARAGAGRKRSTKPRYK
jgi:hypothetical protein